MADGKDGQKLKLNGESAGRKKKLIIIISARLAEALSELLLKRILNGITVETEFIELLSHSLHIVRMAVSHADYCVSAIEIKVFLTFIVPYFAAFAMVDGYIKKWIYVKKCHISVPYPNQGAFLFT